MANVSTAAGVAETAVRERAMDVPQTDWRRSIADDAFEKLFESDVRYAALETSHLTSSETDKRATSPDQTPGVAMDAPDAGRLAGVSESVSQISVLAKSRSVHGPLSVLPGSSMAVLHRSSPALRREAAFVTASRVVADPNEIQWAKLAAFVVARDGAAKIWIRDPEADRGDPEILDRVRAVVEEAGLALSMLKVNGEAATVAERTFQVVQE